MLRLSFLRRAVALGCALALAMAVPVAAQFQDSFGKNKIQYRKFDWKIYHSPHFDIYYYSSEEKLLDKVASFAESAYDRLSRAFDHQISKSIPLIFYATHSAFEQNNIIINFIPESIGAFANPVKDRMVLPVDLPDVELFELVMHELTHVFQYEVIFEGKFGSLGGSNAPQWFTEGMASYMAKDENENAKMFLRDAVVNDRIPSILQRGVHGYMAYRFGHAAFDYIEQRWGQEGFRDFIYEFRNTFGGRTDKALERALKIKPEDFDLDFRRWLRKKYLPQLVATGEPSDFGRPFLDESGNVDQAMSATASPSGDLVASIVVAHGDVDIELFDARKRRPIRDLTKGFSNRYQYLVAQNLTSKARMGRDLAFSPDGNLVAAFVKRERGRSLMLLNVLNKKIVKLVDMDVEQQYSPAWSPDGRKIVFAGNRDGKFDIFLYDLDSGKVSNLTDDDLYDQSPVFSPDGTAIIYSATVGEDYGQLFRLELSDPHQRVRLTDGKWTDRDAVFSSDGKWLYFTSDRSGAFNIWGMELATGKTVQYTNAVTGCMMPTVLREEDGRDRLVYTGFWKGTFQLYESDLSKPVNVEPPGAAAEAAGKAPLETERLATYTPDIQVTIDKANEAKYKRSKLFLEDGFGSVGVTSDQLILGYAQLVFSDYLGDHRLFATFNSVDTFSDFNFTYLDMSRRSNWSASIFDTRSYYLGIDNGTGFLTRGSAIYRVTGATASWIYPFSVYHRVELGGGYLWRQYDFQQVLYDSSGNVTYSIQPRSDHFPVAQASLIGDSAVYAGYGPISGRRWRLGGRYGYDTNGGGALSENIDLDFRQYLQFSERSGLAFRAFGGWAGGASRRSTSSAASTPCVDTTTRRWSATGPTSSIWNTVFR